MLTKLVDFNSVLKNLVLVIIGFNLYAYTTIKEQNQYVSDGTIVLSLVLGIEMYLFLIYEKVNRDPFIIILSIQNLFFYLFRVGTLTFFPSSLVLIRDEYSYKDINYTLVFIIISNLVIFLALVLLNQRKKKHKEENNKITVYIKNRLFNVYAFFCITIFMTFVAVNIGPDGLMTLTKFFTSIFFDLYIVLSLMILTYFLSRDFLGKKSNFLFWIFIILYTILHTLIGSRSAILTIFYCFLFSALAYTSYIKVKKKILFFVCLIVILSVPLFAAVTFMRVAIGDVERQKVSTENIKLITESEITLTDLEFLLSPIFQRIGFLDFATELVSSKEKYAELFSFKYYTMSVIDNILTPGFDVFDIPKTATAQKFYYEDIGKPSKVKVAEEYHSDCFTLYGEFFVLFGGWFAIIPIFLLTFILKYIYIMHNDSNNFIAIMNRIIILLIFFNLLQSFGLDTIIAFIIGFYGTLWLAKKILQVVWFEKIQTIG
jgi:hypothetical protein